MKNDLTCAVVRDLLPGYIEKLTSEETNRAVEQHLDGCEDCRGALAAMRGEGEPAKADPAETREIDYLKKVRTGTWKRVLAGILIAAFLIGCGVWFKIYRYGSDVDPSAVNINDVRVIGSSVVVAGNLKDQSLGVTHADMLMKDDGLMEIGFRSAPKDGRDNQFDFVVQGEEYAGVQEVRMGDRIVWYHGVLIGEKTSAAYNARHAYVGDMPANGELARAIGLQDAFGPYSNELETAEEPYGWRIILLDPVEKDGFFTELLGGGVSLEMEHYAAVLIACIDNLDWVEFDYTAGGKEYAERFTAEQISRDISGGTGSIKSCAEDPAKLQALMETLGF